MGQTSPAVACGAFKSRLAGSPTCLSGTQLGASPGSEPLGEMGSGNLRPYAAMPCHASPRIHKHVFLLGGGG